MKFKEVFDAIGPCGPRIGWEMEACFELERTAESEEGQMVLAMNNGMFGEVEAACPAWWLPSWKHRLVLEAEGLREQEWRLVVAQLQIVAVALQFAVVSAVVVGPEVPIAGVLE